MERRRFLGAGAIVGVGTMFGGRAIAQAARAEWAAEGREPVDAAAMSPEELAHVPVLTLPASPRIGRPFDLAVQIGVTPLGPTSDHRVDWIELRLDDRSVWTADLSADVPYPVIRVPLVLAGPAQLVVRARCTQHGVWVTRRALAPT